MDSTRRALGVPAVGRDDGSERFVRVDEDDESDALTGDAGEEANAGVDGSGSGKGSGDGGTEETSRDEGSGDGEEGDCSALRIWSISAKAWSMAP